VGSSGKIKDRFYAHLRNFKYGGSGNILGIFVYEVTVDHAPDRAGAFLLECGLWIEMRYNLKATLVNDRRYIPGC
jgi:hypothetical protein